MRRVEVLREGQWIETRMKDVKVSELIRLFNEDGTQFIDIDNEKEFYICSDPTPQEADPTKYQAISYSRAQVDEFIALGGTIQWGIVQ